MGISTCEKNMFYVLGEKNLSSEIIKVQFPVFNKIADICKEMTHFCKGPGKRAFRFEVNSVSEE